MHRRQFFRVYVETSALNALHGELAHEDAVATKAHLNLKGKGWFISPVVLWEIQATEDPEQRERLIYFAQHLFQDQLLPSPEELLVNYIRAGCPTNEPKYDLVSTGMYATAWKDICAIKEKTLIFDANDHKRLNGELRKFCKNYYTFTKFDSIDIARDPKTAAAQFEIQKLIDHFGLMSKLQREDQAYVWHFRVLVFYVLMFLCAGAAIDRQVIERFWSSIGIQEITKRIEYTFTELKALFQRGPMVVIALMTEVQAQRKFSRGMFLDCLHSVYAIYADLFISNDEHFRDFRKGVEATHGLKLKLRMLDELQMTKTTRINPERGSFLNGG